MTIRTVPPCHESANAADEGLDSGTWTTNRHDLVDLDALDAQHLAEDLRAEHDDGSWRDRPDE